MSTSRERILKNIKQALVTKVPVPFLTNASNAELFQPSIKELEIEFAEHFTGLQGKFSFCANEQELSSQLLQLISVRKWEQVFCKEAAFCEMLVAKGFDKTFSNDISSCDVSITGCEYLVARTGSMILSSASVSGRTTSVYAPIHICLAKTNQLVYSIDEALRGMTEKYGTNIPSMISLATGPSRTADIEKTLVVGVHGPKEVFCFLTDD
ncbi:MAG: lactate utilization protein B/C [Sphingobacteriia bacterium 28-36-52]|nr:MAG: lactate utilization protein B/C [Sphingobacteriia bacterium 28-36-52]